MLTRPPSGCLVLYMVCGRPMPRAVVHSMECSASMLGCRLMAIALLVEYDKSH
jgi:hypothetical protein